MPYRPQNPTGVFSLIYPTQSLLMDKILLTQQKVQNRVGKMPPFSKEAEEVNYSFGQHNMLGFNVTRIHSFNVTTSNPQQLVNNITL